METCGRPLRCDAARNREAILVAARELFAEQGVDVALEEVARRAGVGIATLYRRFASRDDLVDAAFAPKMDAYVAAAERAAQHPDAWAGFCDYVVEICGMQAADAGFAHVTSRSFPATAALDRRLRSATAGVRDVVDRARREGHLRADFVLEDLVVLLMANAGVVESTAGHAPEAWRRFVAYQLDALRAPGASPLPAPPRPERLARALRRPRPGPGSGSGASNM